MIPIWLWFSLKNKSLGYFLNVNPTINFSGFTQYSKYQLVEKIPEAYKPKTYCIAEKSSKILIDFPFIAKPDVGERGIGVEKIINENEWKKYQEKHQSERIIVQELIDFPCEFGVFYAKIPSEKKGKILSITGKEFLSVTGNGKSNLKDLICNNQRAYYRRKYLFEKYKEKLNCVLNNDEILVLETIGNHNRGTYFKDSSTLITNELLQSIEEIVLQIEDFYYGRFDVKATSEQALQQGKFLVLEINGANSEATHIYDKNYAIFSAYKEVIRHLNIQQKIAKELKNDNFKRYKFSDLLRIVIPKFLGISPH